MILRTINFIWSCIVFFCKIAVYMSLYILALVTIGVTIAFTIHIILPDYPEFPDAKNSPLISQKEIPHKFIPNTKWGQLEPCGKYLNEKKIFYEALMCSASHMKHDWRNVQIPRCFVVTTNSKDLYYVPLIKANSVIVQVNKTHALFVAGFYNPDSHTIFLTENPDIEGVYFHELQHYFLHKSGFDEMKLKKDHSHPVWNSCEGTDPIKVEKRKLIFSLLDD